jgi:NADH pyrophosphatase NudC (nudix superfamily)
MSDDHYQFCGKCGDEKTPKSGELGLCEYCYNQWMKNELRHLRRRAGK